MVQVESDNWSSEEEELNFGASLGMKGSSAIRSATFVERNQTFAA